MAGAGDDASCSLFLFRSKRLAALVVDLGSGILWFLRPCIWQSLDRCWSCMKSSHADFLGDGFQIFPYFASLGSTVSACSCQSSESFGVFHAFLRESGLAPRVHGGFGMNFFYLCAGESDTARAWKYEHYFYDLFG